MLKNTRINREATKKIALALGELNDQVVFVGGAVVSLYIDDPSADDVRPTKDIDITMEIDNLSQLESMRESITNKGFYQSSEDSVICRFRYDDVKVDLMSTKEVGWAPASPWFAPGFKNLVTFDIDGFQIKCLSLPYYLASKFNAFYDRGIKDPRTSQDFEDIVYLLQYTTTVKREILESEEDVKKYLVDCFKDILEDPVKQEAILGNLYFENQDFHFQKILKTLKDTIIEI
ncbi:nucleotidyl transferase AbiEii/AbiGii toxin family protein [Aquiflexum sp. LQ15W]|uniref:nucleotidyl transferase AbiEii/AbiGii toxin family protein n=1 Tax=Cognataquiflexum nitidum TaxID=2922272 RepID=UPI001F1372DA|nr:nucleotidyl transferase AbiEii/AbiGii toxin family protein [Cognataquiflexum nitidum]MCH6199450.1 nucleotidyl transferase AbiEii/AbiGii toxin family protein [Cognataquiflexum nitidum]